MMVSYDVFTEAFLSKVTEYKFLRLDATDRQSEVDGYMKRACAHFNEVCKYDLSAYDDPLRVFELENITQAELDEIADIVSEGMLMQWMKPYTYKQENLENLLNTSDYSAYSPAELLHRVTEAYKMTRKAFTAMINEYSYRHGDLTDLHL